MQTRRKLAKYTTWLTIVTIVLFLLWAAAIRFWVGFENQLQFNRYSPNYFALLPSKVVRTAPLINPISKEIFYSRGGDGPKPPAHGVFYQIEEEDTSAEAAIHNHLLQSGWERSGEYVRRRATTFQKDEKVAEVFTYHSDNDRVICLEIWGEL